MLAGLGLGGYPMAAAARGRGIAPGPATAAPPAAGDPELRAVLAGSRRLTIAGQRLDREQIRRFYAGHGDEIVWARHPAKAAALWSDVLHADSHGLDPALFHTLAFSDHAAALSPAQRDVLLTGIFLSYADALAHGAISVRDRPRDQDLSPEPVDVVAALDRALTAADPVQTIEALAPSSPAYEAMRRAYVRYRALVVQGPLQSSTSDATSGPPRAQATALQPTGAAAPAPDAAVAARRARQLAVNLERLRWLPRVMPTERIVVNAAVQKLQLFEQNRPAFTTRVVVGKVYKQTPEFTATIKSVLFNPPWNVPNSILRNEILPQLEDDPDYLAKHHMRWRGPMAVQQVAGPYSALGRIKFEMQDRFDVYLHDTPERWRFAKSRRLMSHGCVRVQNPQELAALLLHEKIEAIQAAIAAGNTHRMALPQSVPVFIVYQTAHVDRDGAIEFFPDVYHRDRRIWRFLSQVHQDPLVQDAISLPRKS